MTDVSVVKVTNKQFDEARENYGLNDEKITTVNPIKVEISTENKKQSLQRLSDFSPEELKREKCRIWKSLICLCLSVSLSYSATVTLVSSITSLLIQDNLGISALAVAGASQVLSAGILVPITNKLWGSRVILRVSLIVNTLFVAAFFYAKWATMILGAICFGIGQSLLFSSSYIYVNGAGYWYEKLANTGNVDAVLARVSGMVTCALSSGLIWGNAALYIILGSKPEVESEPYQDLCGISYCNQELNISTLESPTMSQHYTLIGTLIGMSIASCGIIFFAENFDENLGHYCCTKEEALVVFCNSWKLLGNPRSFLLVPITVMIGMEESFLLGDITIALISCSLGISMVGLLMLAFGIISIPVSLGQWLFVKKCGRVLVVFVGCVSILVPLFIILFWSPNPSQLPVYFILICFWSIADCTLLSVIFSAYAALFEDNMEEAFSVAIFWWSLGYLIWFGWSQFLCIYVKSIFLIALIIVSFVLYIILEKYFIKKNNH